MTRDNPVFAPATLKDLAPSEPLETHFRALKNSMHYQGSHLLSLRRPSRLPAFSRHYVHGDPPRLIDWRAFARNDQLLIREQRDEASADVVVCLELADTMAWPDADSLKLLPASVPTKLEIALRVALNLCHTHLRMGDVPRLLLAEPGKREPDSWVRLPSATDVGKFFAKLEHAGFDSAAVREDAQTYVAPARRRDVAYWIGDGLSGDHFASWLSEQGKRARFIHVLTSLETEIEWATNDFCYFDLDRERREYLGSVLKQNAAYAKRLSAWRSSLKERLSRDGTGYQLATDLTPIGQYQDELVIFP